MRLSSFLAKTPDTKVRGLLSAPSLLARLSLLFTISREAEGVIAVSPAVSYITFEVSRRSEVATLLFVRVLLTSVSRLGIVLGGMPSYFVLSSTGPSSRVFGGWKAQRQATERMA